MLVSQPLILLNDHDKTFLQLMEDTLSLAGYRVLIANAFTDMYQLAITNAVDLIVLDLSMVYPDAAMFAMQTVRLDSRTRSIPILLCSIQNAFIRENMLHFHEMGCYLLMKPFYTETLLNAVRGIVGPHPVTVP